MPTKLISIIIGLVLVLGTGTLVYKNKKPVYVPSPTTQTDNSDELKDITAEEDEEMDDSVTKTPPPIPAVKPSTPSGITLAQVAEHNSRTSCWSVINGNVYDLTSWIPNHPGGEKPILSSCGVDGSARYNQKHGGQAKPATILGGFKLGVLVK